MAVFKQELNWSTYQDRQLKVLEAIDKSLTTSLQMNQSLSNNMSRIEHSIRAIAMASEASAKNLAAITRDLTGQAVEFSSILDEARDSTMDFASNIRGAASSAREFQEEVHTSGERLSASVGSVVGAIWDHLGRLSGVGREIDKFSEASNEFIRLTGMSGDAVRETRSELMSIVTQLNMDTGGAFSPSDSYQQILSISQGVTSNLEAIEEMARPLLLTQETLDVNINTVADIFNRFYTRYSFSSEHMESLMDEIRGNTAGNSASAEATMENIKSLENWINMIAKDDNEKREDLMEQVSHYTSWLESLGMDSTPYTDYLNTIAYGDWTQNKELLNILNRAGVSGNEAQDMLRDGQLEELTKIITQGVYDIMSDVEDSRVLGSVLDVLGLDRNMTMDNWNTLNSANYVSFEDFMNTLDSRPNSTMEELAEDKYVSLQDRTNHLLELIYEKLAHVQEYLGFGISDLALVLALMRSGGFGGIPNLSLGSTGNAVFGGSGVLGSLASGGYNLAGGVAANAGMSGAKAAALGGLGVAGVGAGVGLGFYGINAGISDVASGDVGHGIANFAGAGAGLAGAGLLGAGLLGAATGPIGWIALAGSAITLLATNIHKAATTIGSTDVIESEYDKLADDITKQARHQEDALLEVKAGLEHNKDLETVRAELINTGILSESDLEKARNANAEGLAELTEAYLTAVDKWSDESTGRLDDYKKADMEFASKLHGSLEELLQDWNDSDKLKKGSQELEATDKLFFNLYQSLQDQVTGGAELDEPTQNIYDELVKAYKDGSLSSKEANKIIDSGIWNTDFQNASFSVEDLMRATGVMSAANSVGKSAYESLTEGLGTFYGSEHAAYVIDATSRISSGMVTDKEDVIDILDDLKSRGYSSKDYEEIAEVAKEYGLEGYAEGTNYIRRNQIALLHEGEAVVPKKYNPSANLTELELLREYAKKNRESSNSTYDRQSREYLKQASEVLGEIKEFLAEWKEDNLQREGINSIKSKFSRISNVARLDLS